MGIEKHINQLEGINVRTAEVLLLSDLKEAPATTCQKNSLVSQGRVTCFETQGVKNHKRCLRLKISFPQGSHIYNSSFYSSNEIDELKKNPDYSSFHPDEIDAHKEPINCRNHAASQCRDCTEGQIWG